jgi:hypothetical protein
MIVNQVRRNIYGATKKSQERGLAPLTWPKQNAEASFSYSSNKEQQEAEPKIPTSVKTSDTVGPTNYNIRLRHSKIGLSATYSIDLDDWICTTRNHPRPIPIDNRCFIHGWRICFRRHAAFRIGQRK